MDPFEIVNTALLVAIIVLGGRYFGMTLGFLKIMSGRLNKEGGARFLLAQKAINDIDDYLEYEYKGHSADNQRTRVLCIIGKYGEKITKI